MSDEIKQQQFFDKTSHQYQKKLIYNSPVHTILEIREIVKRVNGAKDILDYGAGSGRISIPLAKNNRTVWSLDISQESLKNLRDVATKLRLENKLKLINSIPGKQKFDAVVGGDVLHHLSMDVHLPKIYLSLKKGGFVVFSEPGALNIAWYIYLPLFYDWNVEKGVTTCTISNLKRQFKKAGFDNIQITGLGLFPRSLFSFSSTLCMLNDRLGDLPLLKNFAYRYIVVAKKK